MASNLIIVAGSPRSGTTALTRLLMEHDQVFHAGPDDLGTRINEKKTYESGIFVRIADEDEIRARFAPLLEKHQFVLEKTPSNIMVLPKIRKIFPDARLVLTVRSGLYVVKSLKAARHTFLADGPDLIRSCRLWSKATNIALDEESRPNTVLIRYDEFMAAKHRTAERLFESIGLDTSQTAHCVAEMDNPDKELVKGVVGQSIRGTVDRLGLWEAVLFRLICGRAMRRAGFKGFR